MKKAVKIVISIFSGLIGAILIAIAILSVFLAIFNHDPEVHYDVAIKPDDGAITVMDLNIRCISIEDLGSKSWFERAKLLITQISQVKPDIICMQEVNLLQKTYIDNALSGYSSVYKQRSDSLFSEGTPIYFNVDKFGVVEQDSFWLSETPQKKSKSWGSSKYRICSYVVLQEKATKKEFAIFNTHLDHKSELARTNGIQLVVDKMSEVCPESPAFLFGDMNAFPDSETYKKATENLTDFRLIAKESEESRNTYHAFGSSDSGKEIDYCFTTADGIDPISYHLLTDQIENKYVSDHFAIVVKFNLI